MKSLMTKIAKIILRALAVILIGFVSAVIGFILLVNVGMIIAPGFVLYGREGYEATGPIGFVLGALVGIVAGGIGLFGKRTRK